MKTIFSLLCALLLLGVSLSEAATVIKPKSSGGGSGLTSLEGQTGATQTFTDDTNVTIVSAADTHVITWAGVLAVARGGTGLSSYTAGDMIYATGATTLAKFAKCTDGDVITYASSLPACGTVDAANRALSNLASVAINAALIPGTAGALDFGSATKPWAKFYLAGTSGTPGTNNFNITGAATNPRTITLQDATYTVAGTATAYGGTNQNAWTANRCVKVNGTADGLESHTTTCGGTDHIVIALSSGGGTTNSSWPAWVDAAVYNLGIGEIVNNASVVEGNVCVPVPVAATLTAVYWRTQVNGTFQSADGANTLQIRNQTANTTTTGTTSTFTAAGNIANETGLSFAFSAGDCVSGKITAASPATDPTSMKTHATLYFTVP